MKEQGITTFIIIAVVVISLLIAVTTSTQQGQTITSINNETVTLSSVNASTGKLANDDLTAIPTLRNETSESLYSEFCNVTLSTGDLSCNATGSLTCYADYTYYPDTYVKETSSRTLLILVSLILVIAVIIGFYHKLVKKE